MMGSFLIAKIEKSLEDEKLSIDLLRKALKSKNISERGLAYTVLTEPHLRAYLGTYKAKTTDTLACLDYLLDCIKLDLDWDEDYANSREDALFELTAPLDPHWKTVDADITPQQFWDKIAAFLTTDLPEFYDDFTPQFLQNQTDTPGFAQNMATWEQTPELQPYLAALERATD